MVYQVAFKVLFYAMLGFILDGSLTAIMQRDFEGKAVIVTGSSNGIGATIAVFFAQRGAKVTICGRNKERLQEVLDKCKQASGSSAGRCLSVRGDINHPNVQTAIVDNTIEHFGRLDVLVCNHGTITTIPNMLDVTPQQYDHMMNTNLKTPFFLIQKAIPHLEKTKGNIVNISTMATSLVFPPILVYSMSKCALDYMTKSLALELAPRGIRVNNVNPGFVDTDLLHHAIGDEGITKMGEASPMQGRLSSKEEQANVVLFLASDAASFVTGQCIIVDGAFSIKGLPS